jgi:phosphatidylglycerol lysyltransferase
MVAFAPPTMRDAGRPPIPGLALALIAVALADIGGAALTLFALCPADTAPTFAVFFAVNAGAIPFGILSHTPGRTGVF